MNEDDDQLYLDLDFSDDFADDMDSISILNTSLSTGTWSITDTTLSNTGNFSIYSDTTWDRSPLTVNGDSIFNGDVNIKGKSIMETLEKIEERLGILTPNEELESKWEDLRNLRKQYQELEKEILEKEKIWRTLQK